MFSFNSSKNLIYISTEKQQYYPGDIVKGSISLAVLESIHIDAIFVKIKGFEETLFDEKILRTVKTESGNTNDKIESVTRTENVTIKRHEINVFIKRKYCVYNSKCTLPIGNFLFPFEFQLEHGLPGTFSFKNYQAQGSVRFKIKAEVAIPGLFKPNLKHDQNILISQPLDSIPMSFNSYKESNVTFLCCIPKGKISVAANIDRNAYGPGELVNVRLIVDNSTSKINLQGCDISLVQNIQLSAQGKSYTISQTLAKSTSPSIIRGDRADRIIQMMIPKSAEPSTRGNLINCSYIVHVDMIVPWSQDVSLTQPVQIFEPVHQIYTLPPALPASWSSPTVMPIVDLDKLQYQNYQVNK